MNPTEIASIAVAITAVSFMAGYAVGYHFGFMHVYKRALKKDDLNRLGNAVQELENAVKRG